MRCSRALEKRLPRCPGAATATLPDRCDEYGLFAPSCAKAHWNPRKTPRGDDIILRAAQVCPRRSRVAAGTPFRRCASFGCWRAGALDRARAGGAEYLRQDGRSVLRGACMVRFVPYGVWLISLVLCLAGAATQAADASAVAASAASDTQAHAFDFLMGTWRVQNRLLAKRLQHSHQWLQFQSTDVESPLPTGTGNLEYYLTD